MAEAISTPVDEDYTVDLDNGQKSGEEYRCQKSLRNNPNKSAYTLVPPAGALTLTIVNHKMEPIRPTTILIFYNISRVVNQTYHFWVIFPGVLE